MAKEDAINNLILDPTNNQASFHMQLATAKGGGHVGLTWRLPASPTSKQLLYVRCDYRIVF